MDTRYSFDKSALNNYNFLLWFEEESNNKKLDNVPPMPRLESDEEEVKNSTGIKALALNKLPASQVLTRRPASIIS